MGDFRQCKAKQCEVKHVNLLRHHTIMLLCDRWNFPKRPTGGCQSVEQWLFQKLKRGKYATGGGKQLI